MSFFGFGKSKTPPESTVSSSLSESYEYEEPSYDYSAPSVPSSFDSSTSSSSLHGNGPSTGAAEVQQMIMEEQQRALIQQAISKITAIAWDKCSASKPDSELSYKEKDCIKNVTLAYLDTSMFVVHRLNKSGTT